MWIHATCQLEFHCPVATPFLFMLRPRSGRQQWVGLEQYLFSPSVGAVEFTDPFGNLCQRLVAPAGHFAVHTSCTADVAEASDEGPAAPFVEVQQLPEETLPFLLPSRYCESDRLGAMAAAITAGRRPGYDQCRAIVEWIQGTVRYTPGCGQEIVSACEVTHRSHAVCRDLAHLAIACCRALAIPARLVVGYLESLQPMDLHAWFEAYVGGRWYTFDPTQPALQGARLAIAYGRDAADVALYTQFGDPVSLLQLEVGVERVAAPTG
ncbi:MAG: transglutaminase family protein [Synechococcus sp.]|nr:transglutaminase family protein [Synechococcus sp.]